MSSSYETNDNYKSRNNSKLREETRQELIEAFDLFDTEGRGYVKIISL